MVTRFASRRFGLLNVELDFLQELHEFYVWVGLIQRFEVWCGTNKVAKVACDVTIGTSFGSWSHRWLKWFSGGRYFVIKHYFLRTDAVLSGRNSPTSLSFMHICTSFKTLKSVLDLLWIDMAALLRNMNRLVNKLAAFAFLARYTFLVIVVSHIHLDFRVVPRYGRLRAGPRAGSNLHFDRRSVTHGVDLSRHIEVVVILVQLLRRAHISDTLVTLKSLIYKLPRFVTILHLFLQSLLSMNSIKFLLLNFHQLFQIPKLRAH